jgi:transcription-repair coupling factor (superfamily II helicase)
MARNGQVFVLYNRVESIESKLHQLKTLVPEARICYAHGQMSKTELENVIQDFLEYKYDILLCTTIIETGIDMPNVNTLIIYDANNYGLSQLYQLRGRVGRSNRVAYAYLMYSKNKMLNDIAVKRLDAIKEFTELGSGYRIAMRDLALRGAGDILGDEQSGFVSEVGLDLYMKLVDAEIKRLKGEEVEDIEDIKDTSLIDVSTHIDDSYVSDENIKIEIHQKINEIDSKEKLEEVRKELEDRFGKINDDILIYMYEEYFEKLADKLHIDKVVQNDRFIDINLPSELVDKIKFDKLFIEAYEVCSKFSFKTVGKSVVIHLNINNLDKHFIYYLVDMLNLIKEEVA